MALNKRPVKTNTTNKSQKKGFFERIIVGKERSEEYAHSTLPTNRWALGWDVFKSNFFKVCLTNLLLLIGFGLPLFLNYYTSMQNSAIASQLPFLSNIGIGYPFIYDVDVQAYIMGMQLNLRLYLYVAGSFILLGAPVLAGGFYLMRNMIWTEGVFVANDFWRGIKKNYFRFLFITIIWSLFYFMAMFNITFTNYQIYMSGSTGWLVINKIFTIVFFILLSIMCLFMCSMSVTYELKFWQLIKNSFLLTIGLLPQNLFFAALGGIALILMLIVGGSFQVIFTLLVLMFGIAWAILVWTDFSQWVFDKYFNDKIEGAVKNRGIFNGVDSKKEEQLAQERRNAVLAQYYSQNRRQVKPINDNDLKITELPLMFSRENLQVLNEEKQAIKDDAERYAEEHADDNKQVYEKLISQTNKDKESVSKAISQQSYKNPKRAKKKTDSSTANSIKNNNDNKTDNTNNEE